MFVNIILSIFIGNIMKKKLFIEVPAEIWILVCQYLPTARDTFSIMVLNSSVRDTLYSHQLFWRHLCHVVYRDTTETNQAKKLTHKTYVWDQTKPYATSISKHREFSRTMRNDEYITEDFQVVKVDGDETLDHYKMKEDAMDWKKMYTSIRDSFEQWRTRTDVTRLLLCGNTPYVGQHLFINKLLSQTDNEDPYNQALPGIRQVIRMNMKHNEEKKCVLINTVCTPYHFAKEIDGSNKVDGIIYVVDPIQFVGNSNAIYRHFHDIIGEFHYEPMCCWLVLADAEYIETTGTYCSTDPSLNSPYVTTYDNVKEELSLFSYEIASSLRVYSLATCTWYYSAYCTVSSTKTSCLQSKLWELLCKVGDEERGDLDSGENAIDRHEEEPRKRSKKICHVS
jgi:hypothetical protein